MTTRIDLKVGFGCNNLCDFCVQGDKRKKLPGKPLEELECSLREGRRAGATGLVVTGGEPTIHKDILELVRRARKIGYSDVQIQSNGRIFCYEGFCQRLISAGATEYLISLHGSRPEIHERLTNSPASFYQTIAGIRNLKRLGQRVIANSVITAANYSDLPDLAALLVSLGVDQFQLAFVHVLGRAAQNKGALTPRKKDVVPWVKAGLDVGRKAGLACMTEGIPYCFMEGYEDHVAEPIIPATMIFDAEAVIPDYTRARRVEGKAKGPRCAECRYDSSCEGPWREYPELFGWDEFVPVSRARDAQCAKG